MNATGVRRSTAAEGRAAAVRRCSSLRRGRPPSPTATTVPSSTIPPRGARRVNGSTSSGNDERHVAPVDRAQPRPVRADVREAAQALPGELDHPVAAVGQRAGRGQHRRDQLGHRGRGAPRPGGAAEPAPPAPAPARGAPTARHGAHGSRSVTGGRRTAASASPNGRPPAPDSAAGRTIGDCEPTSTLPVDLDGAVRRDRRVGMSSTMTLTDRLPPGPDPDVLVEVFADWASRSRGSRSTRPRRRRCSSSSPART